MWEIVGSVLLVLAAFVAAGAVQSASTRLRRMATAVAKATDPPAGAGKPGNPNDANVHPDTVRARADVPDVEAGGPITRADVAEIVRQALGPTVRRAWEAAVLVLLGVTCCMIAALLPIRPS